VLKADPSLTLRGALVAQKRGEEAAYNEAVFRAYWRDALDVTDRARLVAHLDSAGLDGKGLLETADQREFGELLEKNTAIVAERGVFGSPTFIVGDDLFFGNDRLDFLEERLLRRSR
jgi:2-hydroxychromene-2-carboxylate isomerase